MLPKDRHERCTSRRLIVASEPNFDDYPDCQSQNDDGGGGVCFTADLDTNTLTYDDGCDEICSQVYAACSNSFVIWVGPFLVTLVRLFTC